MWNVDRNILSTSISKSGGVHLAPDPNLTGQASVHVQASSSAGEIWKWVASFMACALLGVRSPLSTLDSVP